MSIGIRNKVVASLAALAIGLGVAAATSPADAAQWHGGGGHFGGGGWHGGGGHWGGGGWRGGHGGYGGWRGGYGGWGGGGWGLGIVGGLAAGAIIASQAPYYGYGGYGYGGYGYGGGGCYSYTPVYDQWGNYVGRRPVNAC